MIFYKLFHTLYAGLNVVLVRRTHEAKTTTGWSRRRIPRSRSGHCVVLGPKEEPGHSGDDKEERSIEEGVLCANPQGRRAVRADRCQPDWVPGCARSTRERCVRACMRALREARWPTAGIGEAAALTCSHAVLDRLAEG